MRSDFLKILVIVIGVAFIPLPFAVPLLGVAVMTLPSMFYQLKLSTDIHHLFLYLQLLVYLALLIFILGGVYEFIRKRIKLQ